MDIFDETKRQSIVEDVRLQASLNKIEHESECMGIITWGLIGGVGIPTLLILINQTLKT